MGGALEAKRKKYIKDEDNNSYNLYQCLINLVYIDSNYAIPVFNYIKDINQNPSLKKYFENNYLKIYPLKIGIILIV